jgi:hypothetical protein
VGLREDILRGVRLFAIVFAAILACVTLYRLLRPPADVQGAPPPDPIAAATAQPTPEPSQDLAVAPNAPELHPLVVPEPPPVPGKPNRAARPKTSADPGVPPPPPLAPPVRARRAATTSGREFEASDNVALPSAPVEESTEPKPLTPKQAVGYKSLIEANANRPLAEPSLAPIPSDESERADKGNRFFRAIGKIFRSNTKKETIPLTLQPKQ